MNRILFDPSEVGPMLEVSVADRRARHMINVLHAEVGHTVRVGVINGPTGTARLVHRDTGLIRLAPAWEEAPDRSPLDLLLALPRPRVMRRLWATLAGMGVGRIILTNASKVQRDYFDTHWLDEQHYRPLLIEGLEQVGDTWLPAVSIRKRIKPFLQEELARDFGGHLKLIAHPHAACRFSDLRPVRHQRLLLAIGPEGGWTEYELELLREHGFEAVSAGFRTFRTDNACVALLALAHALLNRG